MSDPFFLFSIIKNELVKSSLLFFRIFDSLLFIFVSYLLECARSGDGTAASVVIERVAERQGEVAPRTVAQEIAVRTVEVPCADFVIVAHEAVALHAEAQAFFT